MQPTILVNCYLSLFSLLLYPSSLPLPSIPIPYSSLNALLPHNPCQTAEEVAKKKKKKDKRKSQETVELVVSEQDTSQLQQVSTFGMCVNWFKLVSEQHGTFKPVSVTHHTDNATSALSILVL